MFRRTMSRRTSPTTALLLLLLTTLAAVPACQTPGEKLAEETFTQAYTAKRYDQALKLAEVKARDTEQAAGDRERAALVAGLSAYALGKQTVASSYMRPLTTSADKQVAGRANWTLGQIDAERGNHVEASKYLIKAGELLDSDDSARAYILAGDCYSRLKMQPQAKELYEKASARALDGAVKSTVESRLAGQAPPAISKPGTGGVPINVAPATKAQNTKNAPGGPFTVQLGAFEKIESAQTLATQSASAATRASAPPPTVVATTTADGRTLYAVRIGDYQTREAAQAALTRLGSKGAVIRR